MSKEASRTIVFIWGKDKPSVPQAYTHFVNRPKVSRKKDKVNMVKPKSKELTEPVMAREFRALPFIDEQMRSEMKKLFHTAQERVRTGD